MYFIIFRRVWLGEDPLPLPGLITLKVLDIASDVNTGAVGTQENLCKPLYLDTVTMLGLFLVEYP